MLKESKDPKIIWKCIHSLNPSNHIRPHRLVTGNDLKDDNSIDIANIFNKCFTSCVANLKSENIQLPLILVNYLTLLIIKYLKIHNLLYPQ
jgi:hypothetical protein